MALAEVIAGWRVLLGTVLVYVMGYPGTLLIVLPGLLNVPTQTNLTVLEGEAL